MGCCSGGYQRRADGVNRRGVAGLGAVRDDCKYYQMTIVATRLEAVAPDLAAHLREAGDDALRRVAASVSEIAVKRVSLVDPRLERSLSALEGGSAGAKELASMQALVDELDEAAWDLQRRVHSGGSPESAYLEAFRKARAASAVASALDPDPHKAAIEAVYEAQAALGDVNPVRSAVLDILGR